MLSFGKEVSAPLLRAAIEAIVPSGVAVDSTMMYNVGLKVKLVLNQGYSPLSGDKISFNPDAVDNCDSEIIDLASKFAAQICMEALQEGNDATKALLFLATTKALRFLAELHRIDPRLADLEQYGDLLFLDAMKRMLNSLYWPYFCPTLLDGDNKIRLGCEAIMCVERVASYHFVVQAMYEMSPLASMGDICGDGIMDEALLVMLGRYDVYHLLNIDWPKQFGIYLWTLLEDPFKRFVYAHSEEECEQALATINAMLQGKTRHLEYIQNEVICKKRNIALCFMREIKGKIFSFLVVSLAITIVV